MDTVKYWLYGGMTLTGPGQSLSEGGTDCLEQIELQQRLVMNVIPVL